MSNSQIQQFQRNRNLAYAGLTKAQNRGNRGQRVVMGNSDIYLDGAGIQNDMEGGLNIGKAFKKFGKEAKKGLTSVGKTVLNDVVKPVGQQALGEVKNLANQGVGQLKAIGKQALQQGLTNAQGLLAEAPEAALMAAGMSGGKGRKKRERKPTAYNLLVKSTMANKKMSMIEATKWIKSQKDKKSKK